MKDRPTVVTREARATLRGQLLDARMMDRGKVVRCAAVRAATIGLEEVTGRPVPLKGRPLAEEQERQTDQVWLSTPMA